MQIEGYKSTNGEDDENQEFLMDLNGNIYDLNGNFVATIDNDEQSEQSADQQ